MIEDRPVTVHNHIQVSGITPERVARLQRLLGSPRAVHRLSARQAHRTSTLAIATTAFISGALAALGVVAVAAGWHWLGAR